MVKSRLNPLFLSVLLLISIIGGLMINPIVASAQTSTPTATATPAPASLELKSKFPVLSNESGQVFSFDVDIVYTGPDKKRFDIAVSTPENWLAYAAAGYPEKQVAAIELGPADFAITESIKVYVGSQYGVLPDQGEYPITLTVSSGNLKKALDLTAKVTAKYAFSVTTDTGNLTTQATSGKDNHMSIKLLNTGSAAIDSVTFTTTKPDGWVVTFNPDKVDSIAAGGTREVDVIVKPPEGKTIAGDYMVNIRAESKKISATADFRVTVLTPSIWGWLGLGIVVLAIAGVVAVFWKLGRR